ncbi:hypothetical protein BC834DRAFT_186700 [Gloeopeniophorella convolvens]|nr:hypothetical protein BC834DRAFT_186700 [Gloeopeniophorella convolvens]
MMSTSLRLDARCCHCFPVTSLLRESRSMPTSGSGPQQNDVPVKLGMLLLIEPSVQSYDYPRCTGTLLIAVILNFALYGYVLHQFLCYLEYRYKDSSRLRAALLALFLLHTYHLSTFSYLVWNNCIIQYSTFKTPMIFLWPFSSSPIVTAVITSITSVYMINRLYRLTGSKAQMICTAVPAFISPASGIVVYILSSTVTVKPWGQYGKRLFTVLLAVGYISQVLGAVLINGLLMRALHKSRSGFLRSDTVISYLIRQAIQTGLFASIFSIAFLVTWRWFRTTGIFSIFAINLGLLDTMAIMESLLSREMLRERIEHPDDIDMTLAKQVHPAIVGRPSTGPH